MRTNVLETTRSCRVEPTEGGGGVGGGNVNRHRINTKSTIEDNREYMRDMTKLLITGNPLPVRFRREIESVRKPVPLEDKKKKKKEHRKRSEIYERGESLKFGI